MEQDRAPPLLVHLDELARQAAHHYRTVVELIAATTTQTGLRVEADLDHGCYPLGRKITNKELAALPVNGHEWHPEWNYTITPAPP